MSVSNLIAAAANRLTPTDRRIAKAVLAEPTLLAFGTVSDLASRVGTSRPSIVRFATKLGFAGYTDLQNSIRSGLSAELSKPADRIRQQASHPRAAGGSGTLESARTPLEMALGKVMEALSGDNLARLATPIAAGEEVWILSGETSRAGAHALHSGLTMVRPGVHLVEQHSMARALSGAKVTDVAVVFDFARYRRHSIQAARTLGGLGVPIVAITDSPLSPLAALTDLWCEIDVPAVGPFDSSMPAVVAAELLVAHVAGQLPKEARMRIDRTEFLWKQAGTFLGG